MNAPLTSSASDSDPGSERAERGSSRDIVVDDSDLLLRLTGPGGSHLRSISTEIGVGFGLRGDTIRVEGDDPAKLALAQRVLLGLLDLLRGRSLSEHELTRAARSAKAHPEIDLREVFGQVILTTNSRRIVAPKGVAQQRYVNAIEAHDIVFGIGPAGTGKTYLAMAMAIRALREQRVRRIVLCRPAVEAGEHLGFLPGDLAEKVNPYLRPLYDAMEDMMDPDRAKALIERGTIEVAPLAFMRGRTLNDCFVIFDEAQNSTAEQMKMFLTRLGFDSKAVITGDSTQVDLHHGQLSGLRDAEQLLDGVEGIAFRYFSDVDVVRHPLVQRIVRAYDSRDAERLQARLAREEMRGGAAPRGEPHD